MNLKTKNSVKAYREALEVLPGGVNSPVRAFGSIGTNPVFIKKGKEAYIWDIDNNRYIDYCMSWGALPLGHAHNEIIKRLNAVIREGTSFGCPTLAETKLARLITGIIPSMEKVRFVNSGTEAVMSAVRLARAFTNRDIIVKFDGCYHGHSDSMLVAAGSGFAQSTEASSKGVLSCVVQSTVSLPFNNIEMLDSFFRKSGHRVAAIILEIVPANMGLILPELRFLQLIEKIWQKYNCLVIADEVVTGFRFAEGSAQEHYNFKPHLTTLGKIIGGGFPVGAYGGRREIMDHIAPDGEVYQAGTLSGNPVAMNAGLETLALLSQHAIRMKTEQNTSRLSLNMNPISEKYGISFHSAGSMFCLFLSKEPLLNFEDVRNNIDEKRFAAFYRHLLGSGIYLSPSLFETNFISSAHSTDDIDITCEAIERVLQ